MSFNRLSYDACSYLYDLNESTKPGEYMLNKPKGTDGGCFFPDPTIRLNNNGNSICENNTIDVDSELLGLNVKATKCPSKQFNPDKTPFCKTTHVKDCDFLSSEDTRLSNPPCTLRGTGWNRWEWLCEDPQKKSIIPFEIGINNRIVVKDNHRACIPTPLEQTLMLPNNTISKNAYDEPISDWNTYHGTSAPIMHWRCCGEIEKL